MDIEGKPLAFVDDVVIWCHDKDTKKVNIKCL